jgi:hypothetical protein
VIKAKWFFSFIYIMLPFLAPIPLTLERRLLVMIPCVILCGIMLIIIQPWKEDNKP